jgi:hypothetical protein
VIEIAKLKEDEKNNLKKELEERSKLKKNVLLPIR